VQARLQTKTVYLGIDKEARLNLGSSQPVATTIAELGGLKWRWNSVHRGPLIF
jgi:hypothetical protein